MLPSTFQPEFLNRLELFRLRARRAYLGTRQGAHLSPKKGHGIEFADYRKYELGDSPRHIDWGVYARTERIYVKRFQEEQDLRLLILCDGSGSMTAGSPEKWEAARDIALALTYVALLEQDSVMISVPGKVRTPWVTGGKAIHFCGKALMEVDPGAGDGSAPDFVSGVKQTSAQVRFPGVAIVISDFLFELPLIEQCFNALRSRNLDISALRVTGPYDREPLALGETATVVDSETGQRLEFNMTPEALRECQERFDAHEEKLRNFFSRSGVRFSELRVPLLTGDAIIDAVKASGVVR